MKIKDEKEWMRQAEYDLHAAEKMLETGRRMAKRTIKPAVMKVVNYFVECLERDGVDTHGLTPVALADGTLVNSY